MPLNDLEAHFCCLKPVTPIAHEAQHEFTNSASRGPSVVAGASCPAVWNQSIAGHRLSEVRVNGLSTRHLCPGLVLDPVMEMHYIIYIRFCG